MRWIAAAAVCAGIMLGAAGISTASAAKPEREVIDIDCGVDGTLTVELVPGGGNFTPVKIEGGGMFIPVAFSNQQGSFTDNAGNVEEFSEPDVSKGLPKNKDFLDCHFEITFEEPEGTGFFEGDVKGFIVGR